MSSGDLQKPGKTHKRLPVPRVRVAFDDFPISSPPLVTEDIDISWPDLIWAAITVGRPTWADVIAQGVSSYFEAVYRVCILRANLSTQSGTFARSIAYNCLDPSEKGAVSYFVGLSFGKFLCEHVLSVPWMMHLDVYRHRLFPLIFNPGGKPDLVGRDDQGRWIVCEAKGRTRRFDEAALHRAKEQTTYISRIAGQKPFLRIAILSYFTQRRLRAYFVDPAEVSRDPSRLMINAQRFIRDYYQPLVSLVEGARISPQSDEMVKHVPEVDLSIGINRTIYALVRKEQYDDITRYISEFFPPAGTERRRVGMDGVSVELGDTWSQQRYKTQ